MLKKAHRLLVQEAKSRRGIQKRGTLFVVKIFESPKPHSRAGVVVSRAVSAKATERNRIKRAVYDFFAPRINQVPPRDFVVIVQKGAEMASKDDMIKELSQLIGL